MNEVVVKRSLGAALKSNAVILMACIAVQALLVLVASRTYLAQHHTLLANGNWSSTKTTLARGLSGSWAFVTERQPMMQGWLNLGSWHGYQEIVYREPITAPREIAFDFEVAEGAYIVAIFNRDGETGFSGVRFGAAAAFPGAFLKATMDGEFLRREPLAQQSFAAQTTHRARIELADDTVTVHVDDKPMGTFRDERLRRQSFGFRGNAGAVLVDNIAVTLESGRVIREGFDPPSGPAHLKLALIAGVVLLNLGLFVLLLKLSRLDGKFLSFAFLTANLTLLVIAAMVYGYVEVRGQWYPGLTGALAEAEAYFGKGAVERVMQDIHARYEPKPPAGHHRILLVGTSQTWGAGAQEGEDTFVAVLERLLNEERPDGPRIECLNAGFSSLTADRIVPLFEDELMPLEPDTVVISLATNDRPSGAVFAQSVRKLVDRSLEIGARPVLMLEANEPWSVDRGQIARYNDLRAIAAEYELPLVDLHGHLASFLDSGFLWWDLVHLTNYGQHLAAEYIRQELNRIGLPGAPD